MTDLNLARLLAAVSPAEQGDGDTFYAVKSIPGFPRHYVGRNSTGQPSLLLGSEGGSFHAPVRLALIEARFGNLHRIRPGGGDEREELLSVVACTAPDGQAQAYFIHICETIVRIVGAEPTLADIVSVVQRLIDLFRHISRPATRSLNGLLGELVLIAASRNLPATVEAWRSRDYDRFDFSVGDVRLDVKATADRTRAHYLSAEQCDPPLGTTGILASVFIESSGGGQSLAELLQVIAHGLAGQDELILKVQQAVAETLGETLPEAMEVRFDDHLARSSLQFYDMASVPAVRGQLPIGVSHVRFRSDLSNVACLGEAEVAELSPIAATWLPT